MWTFAYCWLQKVGGELNVVVNWRLSDVLCQDDERQKTLLVPLSEVEGTEMHQIHIKLPGFSVILCKSQSARQKLQSLSMTPVCDKAFLLKTNNRDEFGLFPLLRIDHLFHEGR